MLHWPQSVPERYLSISQALWQGLLGPLFGQSEEGVGFCLRQVTASICHQWYKCLSFYFCNKCAGAQRLKNTTWVTINLVNCMFMYPLMKCNQFSYIFLKLHFVCYKFSFCKVNHFCVLNILNKYHFQKWLSGKQLLFF